MADHASVAAHLGIPVDEYDARIRTFVPFYEEMLGVVADTLALTVVERPTILDLGVGTGALAARCLAARPDASLIGMDVDAAMLEGARTRLGASDRVDLRLTSYLERELPACDAIVASISLHHIGDPAQKRELYRRCHRALRPRGVLISADCFPAREPALAREGRERWITELARTYGRAEAERHLDSWAEEDTYFPLADEMAWLSAAGFAVDVVWRRDSFAVIMGVHT